MCVLCRRWNPFHTRKHLPLCMFVFNAFFLLLHIFERDGADALFSFYTLHLGTRAIWGNCIPYRLFWSDGDDDDAIRELPIRRGCKNAGRIILTSYCIWIYVLTENTDKIKWISSLFGIIRLNWSRITWTEWSTCQSMPIFPFRFELWFGVVVFFFFWFVRLCCCWIPNCLHFIHEFSGWLD